MSGQNDNSYTETSSVHQVSRKCAAHLAETPGNYPQYEKTPPHPDVCVRRLSLSLPLSTPRSLDLKENIIPRFVCHI